jgi:hypothetical protein
MRRLVVVPVVLVATLGLGLAAPVHEALAQTSAATRVHELFSRGVSNTAGIGTGCLGTGSPGCLPVPLQYGGGAVEQAGSTNFAIYWLPPGSAVASNYQSTLNQFLGDVGGSTLYGVASQYYQTVGGANQNIVNAATFGGSFVDTTPYPSATLQDSDIQAEVNKVVKTQGWATGIGREFFVFLGPGENECMGSTCSFSTYCAYHGDYTNATSQVLYAVMPYAGTDLSGCGIQNSGPYPNGAATDAEISIASHELMETVTDPNPGGGWTDVSGAEIGDKCAYTYGQTSSTGADVTMNGHPYIVQEEFSNASLGCAI